MSTSQVKKNFFKRFINNFTIFNKLSKKGLLGLQGAKNLLGKFNRSKVFFSKKN
jgi:hypothetical protein